MFGIEYESRKWGRARAPPRPQAHVRFPVDRTGGQCETSWARDDAAGSSEAVRAGHRAVVSATGVGHDPVAAAPVVVDLSDTAEAAVVTVDGSSSPAGGWSSAAMMRPSSSGPVPSRATSTSSVPPATGPCRRRCSGPMVSGIPTSPSSWDGPSPGWSTRSPVPRGPGASAPRLGGRSVSAMRDRDQP